MEILLEVCAFTLEGCVAAYKGGANRIELCQGPDDGGTTPSIGLQKLAMQLVPIPIYPIIRPRGGDFLYTTADVDAMAFDIEAFEKIGCPGVVIGALDAKGNIDIGILKTLIAAAKNMDITVHRAFDRSNDAFAALDAIINLGGKRILTSGLQTNAPDGAALLAKLVEAAGSNCIIMPGAGVRANNVAALLNTTKAKEVHTSVRTMQPSKMQFKNEAFATITNEGNYIGILEADVAAIKKELLNIA
jgi:copper homeostasis protein